MYHSRNTRQKMAAAVLENVNIVGIYKFVDSRGDLPNEGVSLHLV